MKTKSETLPKTPIAFIVYISKKYKGLAVGTLLSVFVARLLESSLPYVLKLLVDAITSSSENNSFVSSEVLNYIWILAGLYVLVLGLEWSFWRISGFLGVKWHSHSRAYGHEKLFSYLTGHANQYFVDRFAGNLTSKVDNIKSGIDKALEVIVWTFFPLCIQIIVGIALIALVHHALAIFFTIWVTVFLVINFWLARKTEKLSEINAKISSTLHGQMVDMVTNVSLIHYFSKKQTEEKRLKKFIVEQRDSETKAWNYQEFVLVVNSILQIILVGVVIFGGIYYWSIGSLSLGSMIMLIQLTTGMLAVLAFIGMTANDFMEQYGKVKEGLGEIIQDYHVTDIDNACSLKVETGKIEFSDVGFKYFKGAKVFDHLNLQIVGGQKVGLVGVSGAGKSTLAALLLRLYDIQKGNITIDNQNISKIKQESLRSNIAFVPQEPLLFHRSITENIKYGKDKASLKEVAQVAKLANAHDFIVQLPQKFETMVGERGVKLSGGQKQRIAIARAMLKNAPILVLDEATSALDSESELLVQEALGNLIKGKTVLAIAHRLSTLLAMDRIIVLDKGKIIEDGTHKELLKKKGIYAKLWDHQAGGFIQ